MKKILIAFYYIVTFSNVSNGANPIDTSIINFNISIGTAIPWRNLGTVNPINLNYTSAGGFAKTGFHFDVSTDLYFSYHFGIDVLFGDNINLFNTNKYNNSIYFDEPTTTSANNFYLKEYLFGFCYRTNLTSKIGINFKIMGGDMEANYPNINISFPATSTQSAGSDTWIVESSDAFVWCFDVGIKYSLSKHICITGDLSYSTTTIEYPYYTLSQTLQGSPILTISNGTPLYMSVGLLKPTVGVAYSF